MMNRREMIGALTGIASAAGVTAEAEIIDAEPPPLLAVLRVDSEIDEEVIDRLQIVWVESIWKGKPPCGIVILPPGADLDIIVDPRKQA